MSTERAETSASTGQRKVVEPPSARAASAPEIYEAERIPKQPLDTRRKGET